MLQKAGQRMNWFMVASISCLWSFFSGPSVILAQDLFSPIQDYIPERRENQSRTSDGHLISPAAANVPGLGFFYGIIGGLFNVVNSESDLFVYRFWGEVSGAGLGLVDVPITDARFTLNLFHNVFDKAPQEIHRRGIDSDVEDVLIQKSNYYDVTLAQMNYRVLDRRIQLNLGINRQRKSINGFFDRVGNSVAPGSKTSSTSYNLSYGIILDLTDDRYDPRKGLQMEAFRYDKLKQKNNDPSYFNMDYNFLFFIPVLSYSTWVFNAYRSDAVLSRPGALDEETVRQDLDFQCDTLQDTRDKEVCLNREKNLVEDKLAANRHGTSIPLGGTQRLQAYPTNRFQASHSQSFGTELRLNMTQEFSPFNIVLLRGIRTGVQFAFFYEYGIVADSTRILTEINSYKKSYGGGLRLLLASGFVIRCDVAKGSEGFQPILIFQYPWNVF